MIQDLWNHFKEIIDNWGAQRVVPVSIQASQLDATPIFSTSTAQAASFQEIFSEVPRYTGDFSQTWRECNELRQEDVLEYLRTESVLGDTLIGTSFTFVIDAFCARPESVDHLLIIDISSGVETFWQNLKADSSQAPEKIQKAFREKKITFIRADFANEEVLRSIASALARNGRVLDTVYSSNIGVFSSAFDRPAGWKDFLKLIRTRLISEGRRIHEAFAIGPRAKFAAQSGQSMLYYVGPNRHNGYEYFI